MTAVAWNALLSGQLETLLERLRGLFEEAELTEKKINYLSKQLDMIRAECGGLARYELEEALSDGRKLL